MNLSNINGIALDLESLGTAPNSIILSVGMCRFDVARRTTWDDFKVNIDAKDSAKYGMVADPETVEWWSTQPREAFKAATKDPVSVDTALTMIRGYMEKTRNPNLWSYGSLFDFPMLEWTFKAAGHKRVPWSYKRANCGRTMANVFGAYEERGGTKHTALDDAKWLAHGIMDFFASLDQEMNDDIPF